MNENENNTLNQLNDEEKIIYLKGAYKKNQKTADITKWIFVGTLVFAIILLIFYFATFKNFKDSLVLFIFTLIFSILAICFGIINYLTNKKIKEIINEGKKIDSRFTLLIEEYELKSIEFNSKISKIIVTSLIYLFLIIMAVIILFPFYWMINTSLKTYDEYKQTIPTFWPQEVRFSNYKDAFVSKNLGTLFVNTVYVGIVSTILSLIITVLSAFAFARLEFKGKSTLFAALLATMMIPGELFTITNYATISQLHWKDTFAVLIIPFLVSVFYIYLLRQNFLQIPNELYLAAKVDGTSDFKYLLKIMVPLSLPTLISITILKMMGAWNSYVWPNLVASDKSHRLITNGLRNAFTSADGTTEVPTQMAAVALVSLPLFLVFIFLRKYIMKGVSRSGIKG